MSLLTEKSIKRTVKLFKPRRKRKLSKLERKEELQGFIFIGPWIIGLLCFTLFPILFSLYASFTNYNVTSTMDFIGLQNYNTMFFHDPLFWISLKNTLYYVAFSVPTGTIGAVTLAVLLNQRIVGMRMFRTVFYLPSVISGVGVYYLWMQLLSPTSGLVNFVLSWFGIDGPAWLSDPAWTKPAIILMRLWGLGGGMLLYLASLQGVPASLYEAAEIDGASSIRRFWHVTLPMITPIIFFEIVTGLIGAFQIFQEGYVMSGNGNGGPADSLLFYNLHLWHEAFTSFHMGYASAMAWILFIIAIVITLINLVLSKYWVYYEGGDGR